MNTSKLTGHRDTFVDSRNEAPDSDYDVAGFQNIQVSLGNAVAPREQIAQQDLSKGKGGALWKQFVEYIHRSHGYRSLPLNFAEYCVQFELRVVPGLRRSHIWILLRRAAEPARDPGDGPCNSRTVARPPRQQGRHGNGRNRRVGQPGQHRLDGRQQRGLPHRDQPHRLKASQCVIHSRTTSHVDVHDTARVAHSF